LFRFLTIAVLSLLLTGMASSQPSATNDQPSAEAKQPSAADQRGTDQVPLTVKVLPAPDAKEQADKAEHTAKEKAVIDEKLAFETQRIADYTDRLAWFTLCLVGIAILQAGLFVWQLLYMRKGMHDATIAAEAAAQSANAASVQTRIARDTQTNLQRPYIFAFDVGRLVRAATDDGANDDWFIAYTVANYGSIPAIIETVRVGFELSDRVAPDMPPAASEDHDLVTSPILAANERREPYREYLSPDLHTGGIAFKETGRGENKSLRVSGPVFNIPKGDDLFFRIEITYRGPFTRNHETGAMWLVRPGLGDLVPRGGDEYNYEK
jgi:hypothetical protein